MAFTQPALPYDFGALESFGMSGKTFEFHYGKHHAAYVTNLNNLTKDSAMADMSLEDVIQAAFKDGNAGVFNNASQVWNHTFFWNSMKPSGGGAPAGALADKINASFGSFDQFVTEFKTAAATQFGSGWAWLVQDGDSLKVTKTPNAENPLVHGQKALLTLDVWEHAYYLDFQNRRPDFIQNFMEKLVNWDFVSQQLG
jgi:superoxide dismutase, Fe-Mn family